jgi:hypothetical protein
MAKTVEYVQYRMMVKKPGYKRWQFITYTGATSTRRERVERTIEQTKMWGGAEGWQFKIQSQTVTKTESGWEDEE